MSRLITPSLISSVDFCRTCPPNWKESAYKGLQNTLGRIKEEPSTAIKKGIFYENVIYDILLGKLDIKNRSQEMDKVLRLCQGGDFQHKSKQYVFIDGEEYCLYGKLDVYFPPSEKYPKGHIIDLKTTKKFSKSKYLSTWQHIIYCLNTGIPTFDYLVCLWNYPDDEKDYTLKSVNIVPYEMLGDIDTVKEALCNKIREVIAFLQKDDILWELYTKTYSKY